MKRINKRAPMPRGRVIGHIDYLFMSRGECRVGERIVYREGEEDRFVRAYADALDCQPSAVRCKVRKGFDALACRVRAEAANIFGLSADDF